MTHLTPQVIAHADQVAAAASTHLDQIIAIAPDDTDLMSIGSVAAGIQEVMGPQEIIVALVLAAKRLKETQP